MNSRSLVAATFLLCCCQLVLAQMRHFDTRTQPRPILRLDGGILYRKHQLEPALMRRAPPEEVIERYARRHREESELLNQLNPTGQPLFYGLHSRRLRPARYAIMLMRS